MDSIAHLIKKENDILYIMGRREGKQEANHKTVENLLKTGSFSVEQIAELADVPVAFVKTVQDGLK